MTMSKLQICPICRGKQGAGDNCRICRGKGKAWVIVLPDDGHGTFIIRADSDDDEQ